MALEQPNRRIGSTSEVDKGKTVKEYSDRNPFEIGYEDVKSYPENVATLPATMAIFFNSIEHLDNVDEKQWKNTVNPNYYLWSGEQIGDVPLKNRAWASGRVLTEELMTLDGKKLASDMGTGIDMIDEQSQKLGKAWDDFKKSVTTTYKRTSSAIHIIAPRSIRYNYGAGWQDVNFELNAMGLGLNVAVTDATLLGTVSREAADLIDLIGQGGAIADAMTKSVINPYTQQSFHGMHRRTFQFDWILAPQNAEELQAVDDILSLLKFHMHPSVSSISGTGSNYLAYPGQIDIEWYQYDADTKDVTENAWLPKISTCVIEGFSTDYTPNGFYSFFDKYGAPTQIHLSVQLKEIHPLQKSDIARGF